MGIERALFEAAFLGVHVYIRQMGGSPSVALNPHTPAEMIENVLDKVDLALTLSQP